MEETLISGLMSLGVGGVLAGIVLFWKRKDDTTHGEIVLHLANEANERSAQLTTALTQNAAAMAAFTEALRNMAQAVDCSADVEALSERLDVYMAAMEKREAR